MELCSGLCGSWWEGSLGKNGYMYAWKKIQPVHPKGNQSWIFIGRTDVEAAPILWPPDVKNSLIGKDPDAGKDWRWEEKGTTADEMVGWHHWLNGDGFESTPGVYDGQRGLVCCSPLGLQRVRHDWASELKWLGISYILLSIPTDFFLSITLLLPSRQTCK